MGDRTGIEWTDATWNPIRGCTRVSEGCRNCYAERAAYRFGGPGQPYEGLAVLRNGHASWTGKIAFVERHLLDPLKWGLSVEHAERCSGSRSRGRRNCKCPSRARRIFVNSMSDLFHPAVTDEMRDSIFAVMALCPQHTFQVLTKRPAEMLRYLSNPRALPDLPHEPDSDSRRAIGLTMVGLIYEERGVAKYVMQQPGVGNSVSAEPGREGELAQWPLPNVWLGVSAEDQTTADERVPLLLKTQAAVRFLSAEPLLGPLDLKPSWINPTRQNDNPLAWVICGGESGPGARPMHPDWARGLRDQCVAAGVPFFFKQWGEWQPIAKHFAGDVDERGRWDDYVNLDGTTGKVAITSDGVASNYTQGLADGFCCISRMGKRDAGHALDGVEWKRFPEARP